MTKRPITVLTIEFEVGAAPIRGRLRDERLTEHPFTGWVGLTHAVSAALMAASEQIPQTHSTGRTR